VNQRATVAIRALIAVCTGLVLLGIDLQPVGSQMLATAEYVARFARSSAG